MPQQNHNPTVFKNLVFTTWYGHGLRAIDISNPQTPREVGYALTVPQGIARTYPVFKDGLIYWVDNDTGLHVATIHRARARRAARARARARTKAMRRARIGSDETARIRSASWLVALPVVAAASRRTARQAPAAPTHDETAFVCPMHPDYTLDIAGKCPRCGMALVRAAPFDVRDYRLDFRHDAAGRRRPRSEGDAALQDLPSRHRRAGPEVRGGAREAVPPVRHQPGHGVLPAHPSGAAGRTARGRST